jgi:glycosyltransferase involved in cell wall biosynthesis
LSKADIVIATSETLWKEKEKVHSHVYLFPNAADVDFFAKVQAPETNIAEVVERLQPPIVGYLGTINRHLDIDLLRHLAKAKPRWTLLIAGGVEDEKLAQSDAYKRLTALPNVQFVGWIREEIPNYFKKVDVCLIPFRTDSDFNQYRNPNKLHEYTAMGKPVVSTDIPCVRSHANIIYIARTKEEFVARIEQALAEDGPERIAERLRWARENTWEKRAERILCIIKEYLATNESTEGSTRRTVRPSKNSLHGDRS